MIQTSTECKVDSTPMIRAFSVRQSKHWCDESVFWLDFELANAFKDSFILQFHVSVNFTHQVCQSTLRSYTINFLKPWRHPKILFLEQNDPSPGSIRKNDNCKNQIVPSFELFIICRVGIWIDSQCPNSHFVIRHFHEGLRMLPK